MLNTYDIRDQQLKKSLSNFIFLTKNFYNDKYTNRFQNTLELLGKYSINKITSNLFNLESLIDSKRIQIFKTRFNVKKIDLQTLKIISHKSVVKELEFLLPLFFFTRFEGDMMKGFPRSRVSIFFTINLNYCIFSTQDNRLK